MKFIEIIKIFDDVKNSKKVFVLDTSCIYSLHNLAKENFDKITAGIEKLKAHTYYLPQIKYELEKNSGNKSIIGQIKSRKLNYSSKIEEIEKQLIYLKDDIKNLNRFYGSTSNEETEELQEYVSSIIDFYGEYTIERDKVINDIPQIEFSDTFKKTNIPDFVKSMSFFDPCWTTKMLYDLKMEFSKNLKSNASFFGKGDALIKNSKKKNHNIEGDFYIYHEMIELAKSKNIDVVYVTSDIQKEDVIDLETGDLHKEIEKDFNDRTKRNLSVIQTQDLINGILFSEDDFVSNIISNFIDDVEWEDLFSNKVMSSVFEIDEYKLESILINEHYNIQHDSFSSLEDAEVMDLEFQSYNNFEVFGDDIELEFSVKFFIECDVYSEIIFSSKEPGLPGGTYRAKMNFINNVTIPLKMKKFQDFPSTPEELSTEELLEHFQEMIKRTEIDISLSDFEDFEIDYGEDLSVYDEFFEDFEPEPDWTPTGAECGLCGYEIYIENDGGGGFHSHCRDIVEE